MMRTAVLAFAGLIIMAGLHTGAQTMDTRNSGGKIIGKITIDPKWGSTPIIRASNYPSSLRSGTGRWYMIRIEYFTAKSMQSQRKTNWLDDITMKVEVLFPGEYRRKRATARMTGSVEFWAIPLDGRKHKALMLIPPQIIRRYAREGDNYKRIPIFIRVSFTNSDNRLLAQQYYASVSSTSTRNKVAAFRRASGSSKISVGGILRLGDVILSRDKTPWSAVDWEHYELIKPKSTKK